jgi:osmoprotectant transport system permease protein
MKRCTRLCLAFGVLLWAGAVAAQPLRVGSKRFTESYILGEILTQTAAAHGGAQHRQGLGNTAIVFEALKAGAIDVYAEYTGTIDAEILKNAAPADLATLNRQLAPLGLGVAAPLGFNNTYALAMRADDAQARGIATLSDLARAPQLKLGLSHEFLGRADGWPGLARTYALPHKPTGLDHGIAYEALAAKQVDAIDIYSTDAKIEQLKLRVLQDDQRFFPRYDAVLFYRLDVPARFPAAWQALLKLEGRISEPQMIAMNAAAELQDQSFSAVAKNFLSGQAQTTQTRTLGSAIFDEHFWRLTRQHVLLVLAAVVAAMFAGIPLGIAATRMPRLKQPVLAVVGVLQTIPSLALLALLIPLVGAIGVVPALIALFLYALLPIVRNTATGLEQVPRDLNLAALALGLTPTQRLRHVELPLAWPVILAGIKTAAIISVGTATIAAFIGAGGFGERIATGLALNDTTTLLAGAIPAAALALLTQALFEALEWWSQRKRTTQD